MPYLSYIEKKAKEEGEKEGRREGKKEAVQNAVIEVLEVRFGKVSEEIEEKVKSIQNYSILKELLKKAAIVSGIEKFKEELEREIARERREE